MRKEFTSFTYLNITQFLGALNDNIYKLLIVYFLLELNGIQDSHIILGATGAVFVLPFLLFSAGSGTLADRYSKRNVIVMTKILELITMSFGLLPFAFGIGWAAYITLFMMATQSAIFGPSKYGIIPEIVHEDKITKANGLMTSFTFLAIIIGTFIASFISDITDRNFVLGGLFCISISLIGLIASIGIEYTPPAGSQERFDIRFLKAILNTCRLAKNYPSLLSAMLGSAYFLFLGAYIQLNIIPFAVESLGLSDVQGGYLFLITAIGIGTGSILAGKLSGKKVELGIVPLSMIFISLGLFYLNYFSYSFLAILPAILILGVLGGLFEIPLDSYIQIISPNQSRGQIVAATNFLSYFGVLVASALIYAATAIFHLRASQGFVLLGFICALVAAVYIYEFFDYMTRFIAMVLSRIHFSMRFQGRENVPDEPTIYICTHTAWNDILLMMGSQRRRMRFFIEQPQQHHRAWIERLYRMMRIINIPGIEPIQQNHYCLGKMKRLLNKGFSICLFVEGEKIENEIEKLCSSEDFRSILGDVPVVPVFIERGEKNRKRPLTQRLLQKVRIPALVTFGKSSL